MDFHGIRLVAELRARAQTDGDARLLMGAIDSCLEDVSTWLNEIRTYFRHYTDHTITHSSRILANLSDLLEVHAISGLNTVELYILIVSALLHDAGMVVAEAEVQVSPGSPAAPYELHGIDRYRIAERIRRDHGRRARLLLASRRTWVRRLLVDDDLLATYVGRICESHTLPREVIAEDDVTYPTAVRIRAHNVNVKYLCFCLRIGDLLDINTDRVCPLLHGLAEPLPADSIAHWEQYRLVEVRNIRARSNIQIAGSCRTQDAHRVLRDWVTWLEEEVKYAVVSVNAMQTNHTLAIGRVDFQVSPALDEAGRPCYRVFDFKFNLDEEAVLERLLGSNLYGRPDVAYRELIQNAVDAIRVRVATELVVKAGEELSGDRLLDAVTKVVVKRSRGSARHTIQISVTQQPIANGSVETWLSISDTGIGMTEQVIEKYLLKIGRSRWKGDPLVAKYRSIVAGEFGMGFLSCLMIADRVIVDTKPAIPPGEPIRVTLFGWRTYASTERGTRTDYGTTVRLRLTSAAAQTLQDTWDDVLQWCPYPEVEMRFAVDTPTRRDQKRVPPFATSGAKATGRHVMVLQGSRSIASITTTREAKRNLGLSRFVYAQDGLWVADVERPQGAAPRDEVLRRYGVSVNVRGSLRRQLTVSRNMVEGGIEPLWRELCPIVWTAIARDLPLSDLCAFALIDYANDLFRQSIGASLVGMDNRGTVREYSASEIQTLGAVCFADALETAPTLRKLEMDGPHEATLLIPDPSEYDVRLMWMQRQQTLDREEQQLLDRWLRLVGGASGREDDDWNVQDAFVDAAVGSVLTGFWPSLAARLVGFRSTTSGRSCLDVVNHEDTIPADQIVAVSLTTNWLGIRNPMSGAWTPFHLPPALGLVSSYRWGLSECVMFLTMVLMTDDVRNWKDARWIQITTNPAWHSWFDQYTRELRAIDQEGEGGGEFYGAVARYAQAFESSFARVSADELIGGALLAHDRERWRT